MESHWTLSRELNIHNVHVQVDSIDQALHRQQKLHVVHNFQPQELANTMWAFAKVGYASPVFVHHDLIMNLVSTFPTAGHTSSAHANNGYSYVNRNASSPAHIDSIAE
eukprot:1633130-Karenia_brevis.AAC.1